MILSTQRLATVAKPSPTDLSRIAVPPQRGDARPVVLLERSEAGRMKDAFPLAVVVGTLFPIAQRGRGTGWLAATAITA